MDCPIKHTPGPWEIHARTGSGYIGLITSKSGIDIAMMQPGPERLYAGEPHDPDALLIMAAPCLLDAAKYLIAAHDLGEEYASGFLRLRAAVAKATYRQSDKSG